MAAACSFETFEPVPNYTTSSSIEIVPAVVSVCGNES